MIRKQAPNPALNRDDAGASTLAQGAVSRRAFLATGSAALLAGSRAASGQNRTVAGGDLNLARVAEASSLTANSENKITSVKNGHVPASSADRTNGAYMLRGEWNGAKLTGEWESQWIEYRWKEPVAIDRADVYWAVDKPRPRGLPGSEGSTLRLPKSYRILHWQDGSWKPVSNPEGLGLDVDRFNLTHFSPVTTQRLRLEVTPHEGEAASLLQWRVFAAEGTTPHVSPLLHAGPDRYVVSDGKTYLNGSATFLQDTSANALRWSTISGPGSVSFAANDRAVTTARFSAPGSYVLQLAGSGAGGSSTSTVHVQAVSAPPAERLDVVYTRPYSIDSPFWNARAKALIVNWIPHCIQYCERTDIPAGKGDGGIDNFIEAGKANRGLPHAPHRGYVFSNAWVHQTVESMCIALMVDANGDAEILAAQERMRGTLDRWVPIILAAQMPDGYLQTAYTLSDRKSWPERWSPDHRGNHEGYVSGYFIESAINHYTLTDGKDLRLYNAAKKLADCWVSNIGPGKKEWFDGHQEMEQALVRFGRFVNDQEGNHRGDAYITLAKFLLDSRRGGSEYDQSHLPPGQQYEAVGHAVRAMYFYSGMADIAAETGDRDYQSAVLSLWDNMVNRKYYVTGGIGSGETSEGFGPNYSLRNESYCESCSSCGLIFFQYKLNLAYHDAKYADLYEQTMYNALLGGVALDGESFTYTNPLINTQRTLWHVCPCCVGNIPRTLLMMPTWTYARSNDGLFVNLYAGSRIRVGKVAGTEVEVVQKTDYPWKGAVALTLHPQQPTRFSLHLRIPNRHTSVLYTESPQVNHYLRVSLNGKPVRARMEKGYAVIEREWHAGDRVELDLPMEPQRVVADSRIEANRGRSALMYGPLVYNVETVDQPSIDGDLSGAPMRATWRPDLLGGVVALEGTWKNGSRMTAIPNYARMNRQGPPLAYEEDLKVDYAPGQSTGSGNGAGKKAGDSVAPATPAVALPEGGAGTPVIASASQPEGPRIQSKVWI